MMHFSLKENQFERLTHRSICEAENAQDTLSEIREDSLNEKQRKKMKKAMKLLQEAQRQIGLMQYHEPVHD